jgi:hypothetical protein
MNPGSGLAAICFAAALGLSGALTAACAQTTQASGPYYPQNGAYYPQNGLRAQAEQAIIDDVAAAQSDLSSGLPIAALSNTGDAEVTLLNGREAGVLPRENRTFAALDAADRDLQTPWGDAAAASELNTAVADLR